MKNTGKRTKALLVAGLTFMKRKPVRGWLLGIAVVLVSSMAAVSVAFAQSGLTWSTATLSQARYALAATTVGSKALFAGGNTGTAYSNVVDIYDTQTGAWSTAALSEAREELAATTVGSKALFAGGHLGGGYTAENLSNVVDIYDGTTGTWSSAFLSQARFGLAATTVGSKALFAGGHLGTGFSNVVDIYNGTTGTWSTATLSQARTGLAATTVGTKAIFAGGYKGGGGDGDARFSNVVDIYDSSTNTWSTATLSQRRMFLAATTVGTQAIFAGGWGFNFGPPADRVDIYDGSTGVWTTATLSQARYLPAATTVGSEALFAGGNTDPASSNVVDIYDGTTGSWSTVALSQARYSLAATTVSSKALFAGGYAGAAASNVVDIAADTPAVTTVAIDIKPGSDPNSINPKSKGKIPVAILTTDTFDVTTVDASTVLFGATGTEAAPVHAALEDVDGDGDTDMILHFSTQATGIQCGDTSASLTGETFSGQMIQGSDSVKTAGCK